MKNIKPIMLSPDVAINVAISTLDSHPAHIVLIVDENKKLLGTVTDGDVRRAILQNIPFENPVKDVMNTSPTTGTCIDDKLHILNTMVNLTIRHLPILDNEGFLVGVETLDDLLHHEKLPNVVVIMAGGRGHRLRPITDSIPKPMVSIAGKPLLEVIIDRLCNEGFYKFIISVNYKGQMIKDYFGDGSTRGVEIEYIKESKPLGTAGSLHMLNSKISEPFLVINGDVLTRVNSRNLLNFHGSHPCVATMCVREHQYEVPFGVVSIDGHKIMNVVEKPISRYMINAGIYLLEPEALEIVETDEYLDMPKLFEKLHKAGHITHVFPIIEDWRDVGRLEDLTLANQEYTSLGE